MLWLKPMREVTQELHEETVRDQLQKLQLNSTWNRTILSFLVTFEHKLLDLTEITKEPPKDQDKRKWLTAAIRGHEGLYQAATMSKVVLQTTGKDVQSMDYQYYYSMLLSQAKVLDQNAADPKKARRVNQTQQKRKKAKEREPLQQQLLLTKLSLSLHPMVASQRAMIQKSGEFQILFGLS